MTNPLPIFKKAVNAKSTENVAKQKLEPLNFCKGDKDVSRIFNTLPTTKDKVANSE